MVKLRIGVFAAVQFSFVSICSKTLIPVIAYFNFVMAHITWKVFFSTSSEFARPEMKTGLPHCTPCRVTYQYFVCPQAVLSFLTRISQAVLISSGREQTRSFAIERRLTKYLTSQVSTKYILIVSTVVTCKGAHFF